MWSLFNQLADVFAPPCLLCGSLDANLDNYCQACYADLPHNDYCCQICALPFDQPLAAPITCGKCLRQPPSFNTSLVALHYLPPVSSLIHAFKDHGDQPAGRLLGACLQAYIQHHRRPLPEVLIPMPLHRQRLLARGFNQAEIIAQRLGKALHIPSQPALCQRQFNTPSQQGLNQQQRQDNLRRAFHVNKSMSGLRHVAIIDDVLTTGASVSALATALRRASGEELFIEVWCVARTLPPNSKLHLY
ncbi:MAG: ComF family protein [Gammaproteobacteria bacterium]|jgi:ComF family protein|nr:ComF family protein [Gammaproteobacteria bacterium]